jgi:hypothetical protein
MLALGYNFVKSTLRNTVVVTHETTTMKIKHPTHEV